VVRGAAHSSHVISCVGCGTREEKGANREVCLSADSRFVIPISIVFQKYIALQHVQDNMPAENWLNY
jgi:hypothetical protein